MSAFVYYRTTNEHQNENDRYNAWNAGYRMRNATECCYAEEEEEKKKVFVVGVKLGHLRRFCTGITDIAMQEQSKA
jgi:hypothetical protein